MRKERKRRTKGKRKGEIEKRERERASVAIQATLQRPVSWHFLVLCKPETSDSRFIFSDHLRCSLCVQAIRILRTVI